ncbi:MAG: aminotransferase class V-fold PLP-dependent enzyme [Xanthomonadales bacterium]|jgi:selenocysteine lyase/cysteine desulfurase|nr:aminotransferase class V-fold PLP-dependent enzyme [Xanthomonadales bacterium]
MDSTTSGAPGTQPGPQDIAEEFPSLERWTYVNHAAVSPWPTRTRRAVERFAAWNNQDGPANFPDWVENEQALRERAARLLHASADGSDIALVPNTTEGINIVARGLDWRSGDNLVTAREEFPTNRMAWQALEADGVARRSVDVDATEDPEGALLAAMDERTRVLAVSSVRWTDGFRLDLERLGAACHSAGVLFFVDAIQHFGALRIDVEAAKIDCLAAGGHKWQMAPEGLGLFYCSQRWRHRLAPLKQGWRMLENPFRFDDPERAVHPGGARFEPGTPATMGQFALNASLSLQEDWGQAWIEDRILANTERLLAGLADLAGFEAMTNPAQHRCSGIVAVLPKRGTARQVVAALAERRVIAIPRGDWVRISPHAYQGRAVVDRVLNALETADAAQRETFL